jgi:hypothetical protein
VAKNTDPSLSKQRKFANLKPRKGGESGNLAGRPKGSLNLSTRVRNLLEGNEKLPQAIAETIRTAVGDNRTALDATIIVGILEAFQGDDS